VGGCRPRSGAYRLGSVWPLSPGPPISRSAPPSNVDWPGCRSGDRRSRRAGARRLSREGEAPAEAEAGRGGRHPPRPPESSRPTPTQTPRHPKLGSFGAAVWRTHPEANSISTDLCAVWPRGENWLRSAKFARFAIWPLRENWLRSAKIARFVARHRGENWLRSAKISRFVARHRRGKLASFGQNRAFCRSALGAEIGFVRRNSRGSSLDLGAENWLRSAKIARFVVRPRRGNWLRSAKIARFGASRDFRRIVKERGEESPPQLLWSAAEALKFHDSGNSRAEFGFSISGVGVPRGADGPPAPRGPTPKVERRA